MSSTPRSGNRLGIRQRHFQALARASGTRAKNAVLLDCLRDALGDCPNERALFAAARDHGHASVIDRILKAVLANPGDPVTYILGALAATRRAEERPEPADPIRELRARLREANATWDALQSEAAPRGDIEAMRDQVLALNDQLARAQARA
jgi:hypothetical protein